VFEAPPAYPFVHDVESLAGDATPPVVSLSDVHGYLDDARSALLAVGETDRFDPVVTADRDGALHWAGNDYVLVFNGDLVDRGPDSEACVETALRLMREAPPGRVRYHLGNHEMAILLPRVLDWPGTYSVDLDPERRRAFVSLVAGGVVACAFEGYRHTYSHAGDNDPVDAASVNATAREAGNELLAAMDEGRYDHVQERVPEEYGRVFGLGGVYGRGESAGLLWMDFRHVSEAAPPQVVGHTRQDCPVRVGDVVCGNVIRTNRGSIGGEAVLVETPADLVAVVRRPGGGVRVTRPRDGG
jgi:hypothetical protein